MFSEKSQILQQDHPMSLLNSTKRSKILNNDYTILHR